MGAIKYFILYLSCVQLGANGFSLGFSVEQYIAASADPTTLTMTCSLVNTNLDIGAISSITIDRFKPGTDTEWITFGGILSIGSDANNPKIDPNAPGDIRGKNPQFGGSINTQDNPTSSTLTVTFNTADMSCADADAVYRCSLLYYIPTGTTSITAHSGNKTFTIYYPPDQTQTVAITAQDVSSRFGITISNNSQVNPGDKIQYRCENFNIGSDKNTEITWYRTSIIPGSSDIGPYTPANNSYIELQSSTSTGSCQYQRTGTATYDVTTEKNNVGFQCRIYKQITLNNPGSLPKTFTYNIESAMFFVEVAQPPRPPSIPTPEQNTTGCSCLGRSYDDSVVVGLAVVCAILAIFTVGSTTILIVVMRRKSAEKDVHGSREMARVENLPVPQPVQNLIGLVAIGSSSNRENLSAYESLLQETRVQPSTYDSLDESGTTENVPAYEALSQETRVHPNTYDSLQKSRVNGGSNPGKAVYQNTEINSND